MPEYDVVVAGGGPSGLQFAREVARRTDYAVAVLEANDDLSDNDKSTGGTFRQLLDRFDVPDEVVADSSPEVVFEGPDARSSLPVRNYVLDFPSFLESLGADAADHGADVHTGVRVEGAVTGNDAVQGVACDDGGETVYEADVVVDATGPAAVLTRELGLWDREAGKRAVGKEYVVEGSYESSMLFRFGHEYAPGGYAWVFPNGDGVYKAGVCWLVDHHDRHSPAGDGPIDDYVRDWLASDSRWAVDDVRAVHAGGAVLDSSVDRRVDDGIVAVGDAVSSINPLLGEGIRPGMESATIAADVVIDALRAGDTSRERLARYERQWGETNGPHWRLQRILAELLYDLDSAQQNELVRNVGNLSAEQAERFRQYEPTVLDLLQLYPFEPTDLPKIAKLLWETR